MAGPGKITLKSSDEKLFEVDVNMITKCSKTIKTIVDNRGHDENSAAVNDCVPLPEVDAAILERVLQWVEHHKDDLQPIAKFDNDGKRTVEISDWDKDFLEVDEDTLFELFAAAEYLRIQGLFDVTGETFVNMMKGKTPEEIRQMFAIVNDLTPAEEQQIREENEFLSRYAVEVPLEPWEYDV